MAGDLLAEIEAATSRQGVKCAMGPLIDSFDAKDRDAIMQAFLRWPNVQDTAIARVLQNRGFDIKPDTVGRHRRRVTGASGDRCQCQVSTKS